MTPDGKIELLRQIPLFSGLDEAELHTLFEHSFVRAYPKNTIIIHEGDESSSLYVIVSGKVKVFLRDGGRDGKEVILNFQEAGEYFGELALLDHVQRSASVITMEPSQFIVITRADFMRCISMHPEIALRVMRDMIARLRELTDKVEILALMDVYGRLARTLMRLAREEDGKRIISRAPSRKDLANMVGSSRETVTRILKDLEKGGYIEITGRTIVIPGDLPPAW